MVNRSDVNERETPNSENRKCESPTDVSSAWRISNNFFAHNKFALGL